jgi:hypothetical protein
MGGLTDECMEEEQTDKLPERSSVDVEINELMDCWISRFMEEEKTDRQIKRWIDQTVE